MKHKYYYDGMDFALKSYHGVKIHFPPIKQSNWSYPSCYKESRNGTFDFTDNRIPDVHWIVLKKHLSHYQWNESAILHPIQKYYAVVFIGSQWLSSYTGIPSSMLWETLSKASGDMAQALLRLYREEHIDKTIRYLKEEWTASKTINLHNLLTANAP